MPVTFVNAGTVGAAASGNITITPPVTATSDLMVCGVTTRDNVNCTFPANWFAINAGLDNGLTLRTTHYWKRCVGAEAAFVVTHALGNAIVGNVGVFRGVRTGAVVTSPLDATSAQANAASTTCTAPTVTPASSDELVIFGGGVADAGVFSAFSSAGLGAMTQTFNNQTALGLTASVAMAHFINTPLLDTGLITASLTLGPSVNNGVTALFFPLLSLRQLAAFGVGQ